MKPRSFPAAMIFLIAGLLVIRGMVMWLDADAFVSDPDAYRHIAWTLSESNVYGTQFGPQAKPTAFRPPLYPWVLSWIAIPADDAQFSLPPLRVGCLHLVWIALTLFIVYRAAMHWWNPRGAWVACLLVGLDPLLVQQSTLVMTETLAVLLAAWITWWLGRELGSERTDAKHVLLYSGGTSVLLAFAYLCRPTFLVWAVLLGGACVLRSSHRKLGITILVVVFATVSLWTLRNLRTLGHPVWATTHGGYTMLLGNNRFFYDYLSDGWSWTSWDAQPFTDAYVSRHEASLSRPEDGGFGESVEASTWDVPKERFPSPPTPGDEMDEDRWAGQLARETIRQRPSTFVWSCVVRVMRLWSPTPLWTESRSTSFILVVSCFYLAFAGLLVTSVVRHGRELLSWRWLPVWTMVITLTVVHSIYWSNLRMRSPAVPGLAIVAAGALGRPRQSQES